MTSDKREPAPILRLMVVENDPARVKRLQSWLPPNIRLVVASSASVAETMLRLDRGSVYSGLMLDHDLNPDPVGDNRPGSTLLYAITLYVDRHVPILVHSMNPAGAARMTSVLREAGYDVEIRRFYDLPKSFFLAWLSECVERATE